MDDMQNETKQEDDPHDVKKEEYILFLFDFDLDYLLV